MLDATRKRVELERKIQSLADEFTHWKTVSAPDQPLEKHFSQIRRVARQLEGAQHQLMQRVKQAMEADALLAQSYTLEADVLELHRIWEFFRGKFALRYLSWLRPFLTAADELAWACYEPACRRAVAAGQVSPQHVKEPPLLFFTGSTTPFAMSRDAAYHAEIPSEAGIGIDAFAGLLKALPVSVIGLPWFQLAHLPDAVVIGHETGHNVEFDLGLTTPMIEHLTGCLDKGGVPPERGEAWLAWRCEVFADCYGALALGPSYAGAQADFLAADATDISRETSSHRAEYPTTYLRMLLVFEALQRLGHEAEAQERRRQWRQQYPEHALAAYEDDIPVVVEALLDGTFLGGAPLRDALYFTPANHTAARHEAARALKKLKPQSTDVRTLVAASRLAFEDDPGRFVAHGVQDRILRRIQEVIGTGTRSGVRRTTAGQDLAVHDEHAGATLLERLAALRGASGAGEFPRTDARPEP